MNTIPQCDYPCTDVRKDFFFPRIELNPEKILILMISEAPPINRMDYFYGSDSGTFLETTRTSFKDAGVTIGNYRDLTDMGIYLTTAIKCGKLDYLVSAKTIKTCALRFLKSEIERFPNIKVIMCMGDFAIKAVNYVYKEKTGVKPIKSGSTYKIRDEEHILGGIRFLPSYTQTGDSFNIEKSKREMIAEDIRKALDYTG